MPPLDDNASIAASARPAGWFMRRVPLGGSPLSQALQQDPGLHGWMTTRPGSLDDWRARVQRLQSQAQTRDWLTPLAPAIAATGRAADRLGRAAAQGVVVTTGQQPGLFGGPAYTFSKALSALAMADVLEDATGVPVAPIFWAATDDADWLEAAVTYVASARGLETLTMEGPATDGVAMADVPLGPMTSALQSLRDASGSAAHDAVLRVIEQAYVPHATVGAAYVQLLRGMLEPLGIAVLDASHPSVRMAADPLLRRALQQSHAVSEALAARRGAIAAQGFAPQVDVLDELSLVFRTQTGPTGRERDRVRTRIPVADAARLVREADAGTLGANVLLRPVIERALLPTIAYHAGPGEYAYFAQIAPIAEVLGLEVPLAVPRWSGEVIDVRAELMRESLGIDETALRDPHAAELHVARRAVEPELQDAIERLRLAVETQVRAVREAVLLAAPVVSPDVVSGLSKDIMLRLDRFERRVTAGVKRREETLMRDVAFVRASVRPGGHSPERKLNLVPMLARFGPAIFDAMRGDAHAYVERLVQGH
ncbi:MAG: bacillithiol biosynthesis BshC [Gemmatimonadaceae bacterium]|nr:bacillithiol biosynthesis BshC [Gemmatimonadaceae bacterium]